MYEASDIHERHTFKLASEVHEIEDDNMSITHSISELLCRLLLLLKPCETGASLFKRTYEASEIHERITFEAR